MRSALFWMAVALLIAAVSHLSYVLIAPSFAMQRLMGGSTEATQVNRFVLLDPAEQVRLLGETASEAISGKCIFDIRRGELSVAAEMPDTFWSLTLYSDRGTDLYTINDRQAGINAFKLTVKRAPGILDLLSRDQSENRDLGDGWSAEIPEPSGIAVFWVALDYPEQRKLFTDILSHSSCTLTPAES
jgi:uncharacterized membrane protein